VETLIGASPLEARPVPALPRRLRWARRRQRGERHHALRRHVALVAHQLAQTGRTLQRTAQQLHITSRTLRRWRHSTTVAVRFVGRPAPPSSRQQRNAVIDYLNEFGPGTTLAILRAVFPKMPRAELDDLRRRYRRVWRKRHRQLWHVLHWTTPGAVWAIDLAEAPLPIDGLSKYLLAVRDLASGQQLLWQPLREPNAAAIAEALLSLMTIHGPPLILKSDNGSVFGTPALETLLHHFGVRPLFSPPGTPSYNGAIEAGIHSLKDRTETHAARHGRPGAWTYDDVCAARLEANATARPHGPNGPTPDEIWTTRTSIAHNLRVSFGQCVEAHRCGARTELDLADRPPSVMTQRQVDRVAIRRALVELGVLTFSRRLIPPPIPKPKADRIT
jgi:transposase InsO family protein